MTTAMAWAEVAEAAEVAVVPVPWEGRLPARAAVRRVLPVALPAGVWELVDDRARRAGQTVGEALAAVVVGALENGSAAPPAEREDSWLDLTGAIARTGGMKELKELQLPPAVPPVADAAEAADVDEAGVATGPAIQRRREAMGVSQYALAKLLGLGRGGWWCVEAGRNESRVLRQRAWAALDELAEARREAGEAVERPETPVAVAARLAAPSREARRAARTVLGAGR